MADEVEDCEVQVTIPLDEYADFKKRREQSASAPHPAVVAAVFSLVGAVLTVVVTTAFESSKSDTAHRLARTKLIQSVLESDSDLARMRMLRFLESGADPTDEESVKLWACRQRADIEENYRRSFYVRLVQSMLGRLDAARSNLRRIRERIAACQAAPNCSDPQATSSEDTVAKDVREREEALNQLSSVYVRLALKPAGGVVWKVPKPTGEGCAEVRKRQCGSANRGGGGGAGGAGGGSTDATATEEPLVVDLCSTKGIPVDSLGEFLRPKQDQQQSAADYVYD